jgi:5-(carboxyamino)imidazole ribonucleotide synthase
VKRLGVIGAGQLGQMLGIAASKLGIETVFLDPSDNPPASGEGHVICEPFDSAEGLAQLAKASDVITYEFENVPVDALESIAGEVPVYPPAEALRNAQDRYLEKSLFERLEIPLAGYCSVSNLDELEYAAGILGLPFVLKTRTLGYDGKGQAVVRNATDKDAAWQKLGKVPLIAEQFVNFEYEVSIIGARNRHGACVVYPLTENQHRDGILRVSRAPCRDTNLGDVAASYLIKLLQHLDYVGVLALELFVQDGKLLANEFAPRVHNSGHWTIEGTATSQFSNHVRAVMDLPLGGTSAAGCAGMVNLIGTMPTNLPAGSDFPYFLHDYRKASRPGRKLGHITVLAEDMATLDRRIAGIESILDNCCDGSTDPGYRDA